MKTRLFCLLLFAVPLHHGFGAVPEDLGFFLLVGQSNMAGRAKILEEDKSALPDAFLFNAAQSWEPAVPPYNRYAKQKKKIYTGINPGVGFAQIWSKKEPVGIVCQARGGTAIREWLAEDSRLYAAAISEAKAAMKVGDLKGILWHQGESDSSRAELYPAKLQELVKRFRTDLGNEDLPFVFGQVGSWKDKYTAFNKMIVKQPAVISNSACVTTEGLTAKDDAHFDRAGQLELGRRYAAAMSKLLN